MWHLFQTVSTAGWDRFKVLPQPDSPSLVEAMRTLYGPNLPQEPSLDTEMAVDQPAVEEAFFTTVTNKKSKGMGKVPLSTNPSAPSQNVPTPAPVVSRVPSPPPPAKTATAKPTPIKVATKPQMPKQAPKSFFFVQKFITQCSIAVCGRLSTTSSLHGPQGPGCPITGKRHYQYQRRNLT